MKVDGVVQKLLSNSTFHVELEDGRIINAKISGRLRKFRIRIIVGDKVTVGLSPYDLTHGIIVQREKLKGPPPGSFPPRR